MKFLEQVADYYCNRLNADLVNYIFIMPNKRSAMFLKRYIQLNSTGRPVFMPRFKTFAQFTSHTSGLKEAERYDKLFLLYNIYKAVVEERLGRERVSEFDKFIFWGDMILNDFDEIDSSLASPEKLYSNLNDLRSITSDYLTDEQKDVIRRMWGDTPLTQYSDTFWLHTDCKVGDNKPLTQKFVALWQILAEVYRRFISELQQRGLATKGMQQRVAVRKLREMPVERLQRNRYVFVGLSDLTMAEIAIMDYLQSSGCADFFWDLSSRLFRNADGTIGMENRAISIIDKLSQQFKSPYDFEQEIIPLPEEINIIGIPSSVGQGKIVGEKIAEMLSSGTLVDDGNTDTAVVLPDESLLMPLLLALPEQMSNINVTMSVPYSSTTFATLLRVIIAMQMRARKRREQWTFFYQDVFEILLHPHIQLIAAKEADIIRKLIRKQRLYNIEASLIAKEAPGLAFIFDAVDDTADVKSIYTYLCRLIETLHSRLSAVESPTSNKPLELQVLESYKKSIDDLYGLVNVYGIEMSETTFFTMFENVMNSTMLSLTGTPLRGLQVMGVLETRDLDFENIFILSLNERTFPRRNYVRTMIPNNLRRGYGLPTIDQHESFYAYHFYRAICRAKRITLLYDSRNGNSGGGEMSRYLTQLLYVHSGDIKINHYATDMGGGAQEGRMITVDKTPDVMTELEELRRPGGISISASALKSYMVCPLQFYLTYVRGLREEDEPIDYVDAATLGNIFHYSMRQIYTPYEGHYISAAEIDKLLAGDYIRNCVLKQVALLAFNSDDIIPFENLTAETAIIVVSVERQVREMLEAEKRAYCSNGEGFTYVKGEMDIKEPWQLAPDLTINFRMQIDRIDKLGDKEYRFIDYKTGSDGLVTGNSIEGLFKGEHSKNAIFQLLLYAEVYNDIVCVGATIHPSLHILRKIMTDGDISPITYNGKPMEPYPALHGEFRPRLEQLVRDIFDAEIPFSQTPDVKDCTYCKFAALCGRITIDKSFV